MENFPIQWTLLLSLLFPFSNFLSLQANSAVWKVTTLAAASPIDVELSGFAIL
jgi:hypothetical protein